MVEQFYQLVPISSVSLLSSHVPHTHAFPSPTLSSPVNMANGHRRAMVGVMRLFIISLLVSLPIVAQESETQKKFAGTWEAKWHDKVICTLRLKAGDQISGETSSCSINIDANGDLQEPDSSEHADTAPLPILNPKLQADTLA